MKLDLHELISRFIYVLALLAVIAIVSHAYWGYEAFELYLDEKRINQLSLACTDKILEQLQKEREELFDELMEKAGLTE